MQVTVLGAHNLESATTRLTCFLIDGIIALDAGSLTRSLTFEEQDRIRSLLLTHHHLDHIRDIATLGLFIQGRRSIDLYAPDSVLNALTSNIINNDIYPDFTQRPSREAPTLRTHPVRPGEPFELGNYRVLAANVPHGIPTVGYQITSSEGASVFFTGDCGPGLSACWPFIQPQTIFVDLTVPNRLEAHAVSAQHLSPGLLKVELLEFRDIRGYLPRIIAIHLTPQDEREIGRELAELGHELGASIELGHEDMIVEV